MEVAAVASVAGFGSVIASLGRIAQRLHRENNDLAPRIDDLLKQIEVIRTLIDKITYALLTAIIYGSCRFMFFIVLPVQMDIK